jgi:hypothetical protein
VVPRNHPGAVTYLKSTDHTPRGENGGSRLGYFGTHTSIQAERIVQPFIGKPLRVEGKVVNIMRHNDAITAHLRNDASNMILGYFESSWADRLAEPNLDDELALMGRIKEISSSGLSLVECEVIE